ncbi:MAG TPA: DUF5668 domain-containing protein [Candidatus Sulfotelmatobacter sp.]|jgi:hypothetical protein|nr:DUF5668 domain-containing protein [Candidatus Sulfotelmatobacter sp.]
MKCAVHPEVDATGFCRNCGKALCGVCARPVREVLYCEDCLASGMGMPAPAPTPQPSVSDPYSQAGYVSPASPLPTAQSSKSSGAVAFMLGLFPGLGAVYNGEYNKALIHVVVFTALVFGLANSDDMSAGAITVLSLLLAGFILYMAFDAMRVAQAKGTGQASTDPLEGLGKNWPMGPIILIGVGALMLLSNFRFFEFFHLSLSRLWPLILIVVGVLMFRKRLGQ